MDPKGSNTRSQAPLRVVPKSCPLCGEERIATNQDLHAFDYGSGDTLVTLQVRVPVRRCSVCAFEYLDEEAERLKHAAVCEHLGVLPPDAIRRIRERYKRTRTAFARVTGLGEASLNRWENGLSIQSHANDRYLRLLAYPEVMSRLLVITAAPEPPGPRVAARFRVVEVTTVLRKEQQAFHLRRVA